MEIFWFRLCEDATNIFLSIHTYLTQRRTLYIKKMYNKSRLTVRVKCFKSKMVQTLCCQHSKCEAALTYMISVNHINDTVQHSEITFDHICADF